MTDNKSGYKKSTYKQSRYKHTDEKSGSKSSGHDNKKSEKKADKKKDRAKEPPAPPRPRATTMTPTEILPNLFVGTREDAEAIGEHVPDGWVCISVTEFRSRYGRKEELPYEPVGSLDLPFMTDHPNGWHADPHKLDLIAETIALKLAAGKKVLVHCIHAQERAPLAVAWYLAWSGATPSVQSAYDTVAQLHLRTERRDAWLRDASPGKRSAALVTLLDAARSLATAGSEGRADAIAVLESAAIAWSAPSPP